MTLSDQGYSPTASLFTRYFSYSCEGVDQISTVIVRRAVPLLVAVNVRLGYT